VLDQRHLRELTVADAGKYVLLDLFWDERTNEYDKPVPLFQRHLQGEVLDLDEAEATRLLEAGSVEAEGEREGRELRVAHERFLAALANAPDDVRAKLGDVTALDLQDRAVTQEELHVHHPDAVGFTNPGHPKYASATQGEGGVGEGLDEAGDETATTDELDATQASLDDGSKQSSRARGGSGAQRDRDAQAKRADIKAPAEQQ
jgi:hypothetical protein